MLEGLTVGRVIHYDDAVRAAVVAAGDGAEALLPRRVPNLQLDRLALQLDRADFLRGATRRRDTRTCRPRAHRTGGDTAAGRGVAARRSLAYETGQPNPSAKAQ